MGQSAINGVRVIDLTSQAGYGLYLWGSAGGEGRWRSGKAEIKDSDPIDRLH